MDAGAAHSAASASACKRAARPAGFGMRGENSLNGEDRLRIPVPACLKEVVEPMLEELKERVWEANLQLPKNGLVTMTSGNVSGRDPERNLVVMKPSGVTYEKMRPSDMVVVDMQGNVVDGELRPSVDTATHLYIYRHRPDVHGIVHTHSPYATSFAALGRSIPVYLT